MKKSLTGGLAVAYGLLFLFVFYFAFLPIPAVVVYAIAPGTGGSLQEGWFDGLLSYFRNSLALSFGVTLAATVFGFILAFTLKRIRFQGRGVLKVLALLPLINPPFVGTIAYVMLFGKRGLVSHTLLGLETSAFGWQGVFVLQVLGLGTLAYLLISGSIEKTDLHLEEAARNLGAREGRIFFTVTLPMMLPELSGTALLVFLTSMADFGTPLIIGGDFQTLASQLYIQITGLYDMRTAAVSGIALLVPCLLAFGLHRRLNRERLYGADYVVPEDLEHRHIHPAVKAFLLGITLCFTAFATIKYLFILLGALTVQWGHDYTLTLSHVRAAFSRDLRPFINTIRLALLSAAVASFLGVLLAYIVRNKKPPLSGVADLFGVLPAAVPGILFGIGYLVVFRYPLFGVGSWYLPAVPMPVLLGTGIIIYLVCIARFMNVGLRSGYALLAHLDRDMESAAYTLGAGEGRTFFRVMLPQLGGAFSTAFIRNLASGMTTLGAIIFLLLPRNKVAVQVIFQVMTGFALGPASVLALTLSLTSLSLIGLFTLLFHLRRTFSRRFQPLPGNRRTGIDIPVSEEVMPWN